MHPYILVKEYEVFQVLKNTQYFTILRQTLWVFLLCRLSKEWLYFKTFRILLPYFKAILSFRDSFTVSLQKKGRKFYSLNET